MKIVVLLCGAPKWIYPEGKINVLRVSFKDEQRNKRYFLLLSAKRREAFLHEPLGFLQKVITGEMFRRTSLTDETGSLRCPH